MKKKKKFPKEIIIGLFAVCAMGLMYYGINYLKDNNLFNSSRSYKVNLSRVDGLQASDPVMFKGMKIGSVRSITILQDAKQSIEIVFAINNDQVNVYDDTEAVVKSGLLSSSFIDIVQHESKDILPLDSFLAGSMQESIGNELRKELEPIRNSVSSLISSLDSIASSTQAFWDVNGESVLTKSLKNFEITASNAAGFSAGLNNQTENIGSLIENLEVITRVLRNNQENINGITANLNKTTESLSKAQFDKLINDIDSSVLSLNAVITKMNGTEGSLGKMLNEETLHEGIVATNESLRLLLEDLKAHPKRYVHFSLMGKKEKGLKLNSDEEEKLKSILKEK